MTDLIRVLGSLNINLCVRGRIHYDYFPFIRWVRLLSVFDFAYEWPTITTIENMAYNVHYHDAVLHEVNLFKACFVFSGVSATNDTIGIAGI